jgi:hypothetical protein
VIRHPFYDSLLSRLLAALAAGLVGVGCSARGQEEPDRDDPDEKPPVQAHFELPEEQFDQWVFEGRGDVAAQRTRLDSLLRLHLDDLDRICRLTESQKKKLQLAGRGDLTRFFDRVEVVRVKFRAVRKDQNKVGEIFQEIQPLQQSLQAGMFHDASLLYKTLQRTLTAEQLAGFGKVDQERRRVRYQAKVGLAVAMLENSMPLDDQQRQKLLQLIEQETQPPKKFGQYDYYVVLVQMSKIPENKLKPLLDEGQWRVLKQQLTQMRGMEQFLKQNGFLP